MPTWLEIIKKTDGGLNRGLIYRKLDSLRVQKKKKKIQMLYSKMFALCCIVTNFLQPEIFKVSAGSELENGLSKAWIPKGLWGHRHFVCSICLHSGVRGELWFYNASSNHGNKITSKSTYITSTVTGMQWQNKKVSKFSGVSITL